MMSMYEIAARGPVRRKRPQASPVEKLYRQLEVHRANEQAVLEETERARALAAEPFTQFVLDLIEDGQSKQLDLSGRMLASIRDALYWTCSPEAVPEATGAKERAAALDAIRALVREEAALARSARRLAKSYAGINAGLEHELLVASALQRESNIRLLRLLIDRLEHEGTTPQPTTMWDAALRQRKLAACREETEAA